MSKEGVIDFEGKITDVRPNQNFLVELENGRTIACYSGGKIKKNKIKLVLGDKVKVEMSPYDLTKGRIVFRL